MPTDLIYPDDIDAQLNWPLGRASRLARAGKLPHYLLPDGAIRFRLDEVASLVRHVVPKTADPFETIQVCRPVTA
ncbi:hypothetical protein [Limnoglobus roseus]|uniref:DNA-binding protein n=1 Tax=Limnoglobus roseus TaxID=2598579 RepID=A0A5C1ABY1_9BACT|nr:hypothetical protein [Limnoglobus roseus]QEL14654.1 hypothetical protein PX52LOC_01547 [Limnoglobus roseus]